MYYLLSLNSVVLERILLIAYLPRILYFLHRMGYWEDEGGVFVGKLAVAVVAAVRVVVRREIGSPISILDYLS